MDPIVAISEGEWNSFNGMCPEEADFMTQLLGNCSLPNEVPNGPHHVVSTFWPSHDSNVNIAGVDESSMYSSEETNTSMYSFSQSSGFSGGSSVLFPSSSHDIYYPTAPHHFFVANNNLMTMDYGMMDNKNNSSQMHIFKNSVMEGDDFLNQDVSNGSIESNENMPEDVLQGQNLQLGRETEPPMPETLKEEKVRCPSEISKKRSRIPADIPRSKRNTKLRKCMKTDDNDEENNDNNNVMIHRPCSSSYCSEDESNASHEQSGVTSSSSGVPKLNGKARANRGSATDPQSLYARKRRERINERLRILQNLVPNGTKVDISTMLEEAVQYVNFLKLQIKLLSSDDHWMYAPIAYNGMGLDLKISLPKSQT